ncbi:MAG TPA: hypothetical protein VFX30_14625 [bacterium]|nr:hypothetical protein [bacterium]
MSSAILPFSSGLSPVLPACFPTPASAALQDIERTVADTRLRPLLDGLPPFLGDDDATLRRVANLIAPVDSRGTRGSYAGWITRETFREAAKTENPQALASLLLFFQRGGALRDLESRAAPLLRGRRLPSASAAPGALDWMRSPLREWRQARADAVLRGPDVSVVFSKISEVEDFRFRLRPDPETGELFEGQKYAYLRDPQSQELIDTIEEEAPFLTGDEDARLEVYKDSLDRIRDALREAGPDSWRDNFKEAHVIGALSALGDAESAAVAARIDTSYGLKLLRNGDYEAAVAARVQKENRPPVDTSRQDAIYFPKHFRGGPPTVYARSYPLTIPWDLDAAERLFEVAAHVIHEDRHHRDQETLPAVFTEEDHFAFELRGNGDEILWRARKGDYRFLKPLTRESLLGFGMAYRDRYEACYPPALISTRPPAP